LLLDIEWEEALLIEEKFRSGSDKDVDIQASFETLIKEQTALLGRADPVTLRSIWVYGDILRWAGKINKAEIFLLEAVSMYDRLETKDRIEAHSAEAALGKLRAVKHEYKEALVHYHRARKYFGGLSDARSVAEALDLDVRIAQVRTKYGPVQEARKALEHLLTHNVDSGVRTWATRKLDELSQGT
jgi:tetratricopeptide (TPR) repeat protein